MDERLQDERVARWDTFREACNEEEQRWLDGLVDAVVQAAHSRHAKNFGPSAAKEVLISLVDLDEKLNQDFKRQKALENDMDISIDKILPNPEQPRRDFSHDELVDLAQSIRQHGVINAIAVEQIGENYVLIDGERRFRAAIIAGLTTIPANIRPGNSNSQARLIMALTANLQRADMNPIEEAKAFARLRSMGLSNTKIARQVGVSLPLVVNRLRLLDLEPEIQDLVEYGHLPMDVRVADALLSIPDQKVRIQFAQRVARPGIGIKGIQLAADKLVRSLQREQPLSDGTPALQMAVKKAKRANAGKPAGWDALRQLGKVPKWEVVRQVAKATCENCSLQDVASEAICRDCQAVELIRRMMEVGDGA